MRTGLPRPEARNQENENVDKTDVYTISGDEAKEFVHESPWGVAKVSPDGIFEWVNPAYCEILGCPGSPGLVQGTHYRDWSHPDEVAEDERLAGAVRAGEIPAYMHIKRYRQRGSTPQLEIWVWGQLSVWGRWDKSTGEFLGYRVQFQPFLTPPKKELVSWKSLQKVFKWGVANKKTVALIVITTLSVLSASIRGNWQEVLRLLQSTQAVQSSADSALDSSSPAP